MRPNINAQQRAVVCGWLAVVLATLLIAAPSQALTLRSRFFDAQFEQVFSTLAMPAERKGGFHESKTHSHSPENHPATDWLEGRRTHFCDGFSVDSDTSQRHVDLKRAACAATDSTSK